LCAAELLRSRIVRLSDVGLARLAPSFAAALQPGGQRAEDAVLDALDRDLLVRARESLTGWLAAADRVPASELIDRILRESAYAFELGGRRLDQARENIKKVRALIRRVENRGYATLDRLARYFETLRAGDESNAIVEAGGAVSLMTMHAAKGLEFPIVFLVNLHLAGRGRPAGFSVIEQGPDGEPEVAFGSTDGTRLEELRESEELRRLLYVAVTRARDRLYLAGEVDDDGRLRRGARSLAALLPGTLVDLFTVPSSTPDASEAIWAAGDTDFAFRICRPPNAPLVATDVRVPEAGARSVPPVLGVGARRIVPAAPAAAANAGTVARRRPRRSPEDDRRIGTIVHRLFQRRVDATLDDEALAAEAAALMSPEERVDVADLTALVRAAAGVYRSFRQRPDVAALVDRGTCWYEVPFSFAPPDRPDDLVRGVVDCLVVEGDGTVTVLEFKTGDPRPEHEIQAAVYAEAMRSAFGVPEVQRRVLYA
jgi:ATP-dependent exoDNAse (exonuclease V) beta subunit